MTIGGERIRYRATAARLPLLDDAGKAKAHVFYVAYEKLGDGSGPQRPITFTFNGGPGSSSVWLHLGALGPKRVVYGDEGEAVGPPHQLADNPESWLAFTDLVFIDPVTTGYSRAVEGESDKQFHGLEEDLRAVGEFIRLYTTRNGRWLSPKFLAGESYGTTRAAGLARYLQEDVGMYLNGICLISPVLNFATLSPDPLNDMPYWLFLPSYAATAFHHKKLGPAAGATLDDVLKNAEAFASGEYMAALSRGAVLPEDEKRRIAARLAQLTGLSETYLLRTNLRVRPGRFFKELLRDEGKTVGRFDSRYTGDDRDDAGEGAEFDPSYAVVEGPFTAALNHLVRVELKYESDLNYEILTGKVQPWNYSNFQNRYVDVSDGLRRAMNINPRLHVWVSAGYFDLATPYFAADHTMRMLPMEPDARARIVSTYYLAGHMMYLRRADREKMQRDAAAFYENALRPAP